MEDENLVLFKACLGSDDFEQLILLSNLTLIPVPLLVKDILERNLAPLGPLVYLYHLAQITEKLNTQLEKGVDNIDPCEIPEDPEKMLETIKTLNVDKLKTYLKSFTVNNSIIGQDTGSFIDNLLQNLRDADDEDDA